MIHKVNIRALKDRLSAYLRDVRGGDVVLVTDRGQVVAELRQPTSHLAAGAAEARLSEFADRGSVRIGLPNSPEAYSAPKVRLASDVVQQALAWARGTD